MRKSRGLIALLDGAAALSRCVVSGSDSGAFYRDVGATLLLAAIRPRPGTSSAAMPARSRSATPCSSGSAPICRCCSTSLWGWPPLVGIPFGIVVAHRARRVVIGLPTFRLTGHYFSMATIAVAELIRIFAGTWDLVGAAIGLQGPATARGWWDLTFRSELPYYYIFLAVLALVLCVTGRDRAPPLRLLSARDQRRASARRAASACRCGGSS